jgi:ABC-type transporter Mla MlaB component
VSKADGVLALPARVDATTVAGLYRDALRAPPAAAIDFAAVADVDSAGVALVLELVERARRAGVATELRNVPEHYAQLCAAHRVAIDG